MPNPELLLRDGEGWQPVYRRLELDWVDRGSGSDESFLIRPAKFLERLRGRAAGGSQIA